MSSAARLAPLLWHPGLLDASL